LLVCVDDVHLWDAPSRAVLGAVAAHPHAVGRVGLLLSFAGHLAADPYLARCPSVDLSPLAPSEAAALLDEVTEPGVDRPVREAVLDEAEGNPALLLALVSRLARAGSNGRRPPSRPSADAETLAGLVGGRPLAGLPPQARDLALIAAAALRETDDAEVDAKLVRGAAARMSAGASPDSPGASAGGAERSPGSAGAPARAALPPGPVPVPGVLVLADGRFRFAGALIRKAVYAGAGADRCRAAHRALAAVLSADGDTLSALLHRSWSVAGPASWTADALAAAADADRTAPYRLRSAAYTRAAELTTDGPARAHRYTLAAEQALTAGRPHRALRLLTEARGCAAPAAVHGRAELVRGMAELRDGPVADAHETLLLAASLLAADAPAQSARAALAAADAAWAAGDMSACHSALASGARVPDDARDAIGTGGALYAETGDHRPNASPGIEANGSGEPTGAGTNGGRSLVPGADGAARTASGEPAGGRVGEGGRAGFGDSGRVPAGGGVGGSARAEFGEPTGTGTNGGRSLVPGADGAARTASGEPAGGGVGQSAPAGFGHNGISNREAARSGGAAVRMVGGGPAEPSSGGPVPPAAGKAARPSLGEAAGAEGATVGNRDTAGADNRAVPGAGAGAGSREALRVAPGGLPASAARPAPTGLRPVPTDLLGDHRAGMRAVLDGRFDLAVPPLRRVADGARAYDGPDVLMRAAAAALLLGDVAVACRAGARALAAARNQGSGALAARALEYLAYAELRAGRHAQGRGHAEEGLRAAHAAGQRNTAAHHHAVLALAASIEGDTTACDAHVDAALTTARRHGLAQAATLAHWAAARADLGWGRPLDAADRLGPLVLPGPRRGHFAVWMLAVPCFVEAAVLAGRPDEARAVMDDFARWAACDADPHAGAQLARCHALLAAPERADAFYRRALLLHEPAGGDFERARTELSYGKWLRRRRRLREARGRLGSALIGFERCGARVWAGQTRGELRANGTAAYASGPGPDPLSRLTPQQLRIARRVAEGATNREVALSLAVSTRTVDYHLRNVFALLGLRSRVELARMVDQAEMTRAHP
jgi:DNA-binding CsgD family transcriptional regulator